MRRLTVAVVLFAVFALGSDARAQDAEVDPVRQELRALIADDGDVRADRAVIRAFLDRPAVERAAGVHGIDLDRAREGVATLDAGQAADLAERVTDVEEKLAGGDTIVITTTTIIIVLLILILIQV